MDTEPEYNRSPARGLAGLIILAWGVLLLLSRIGYPIPHWIFTLSFLIIVLGVFIAIRRRFRGSAWWILILIGSYLLARHQGWMAFSIGAYFWPLLFIIIGLSTLMRARVKFNAAFGNITGEADGNNTFNSTAIFWGTRKAILSKQFAKGDIVNVFGGTEINFMQADINGTAVVDLVNIFGGVKLIVPSDWDVRVNVVHVFAGTDDKRRFHNVSSFKKVLLVNGTAIFGGVDIISY